MYLLVIITYNITKKLQRQSTGKKTKNTLVSLLLISYCPTLAFLNIKHA